MKSNVIIGDSSIIIRFMHYSSGGLFMIPKEIKKQVSSGDSENLPIIKALALFQGLRILDAGG